MPKRNTNGPAGGRRASNTGKPFKKTGKKDSERPGSKRTSKNFTSSRSTDKSSSGEKSGKGFFEKRKTSAPRGAGKFDKEDKPFRERGEGRSSDSRKTSAPRGAGKFGREDKPFRERGEGRSSDSRKTSAPRGAGKFSREDKPFRERGEGRFSDSRKTSAPRGAGKFGREDKPFRERGEGRSSDDRKTSAPRGTGKFSREDKPFRERGEGRSSDSRKTSAPRGTGKFGREDKPFRERGEGRSSDDRKTSAPRGAGKFGREDKPFRERGEGGSSDEKRTSSRGKFGEGTDKPFRKSREEGSTRPVRRVGTTRADDNTENVDNDGSENKGRGYTSRASSGAGPRSRSRKAKSEETPSDGKIRLNRFIANSGVCSRREADELITMGLISVNGKTITELGYKVNPTDEVRHESRLLRAEKPVYILLNKPKGFLTTTVDPQERNTVMHILGGAVKERVYPVGRLDRNTTGLLLLTNDGDLADKLMHPSYKAKKIYKVELDRPLTKGDFQQISEGLQLDEGRAMIDDLAIISEDNKTVGIELHIGWNRVVRRIFETLGYEVIKLDRSVYAGLDKKDLPRGHWRFLKQEEIVRLKHLQ